MYMTFITDNSTEKFIFQELNAPKKALVVSFYIFQTFQSSLVCYIDVFNLLASVAIYDVTDKLERYFEANSSNKMNIRSLLAYYEQMWSEVNKINGMNRGAMLVVYVQIITWLASTCVDLIEENNWLNRAFFVSFYVLYALTFIIAAEANQKVSFKVKWIQKFCSLSKIKN